MTVLAAGRQTNRRGEVHHLFGKGVQDGVTIFEGGITVIDVATGYLRPGRASTTDVVVGVAVDTYVGGATAGAVIASCHAGVFAFATAAAADEILLNDIGKICYVVDDQTVGLTDGTGTRIPAGYIFDVDSHGVWVALGLPESK